MYHNDLLLKFNDWSFYEVDVLSLLTDFSAGSHAGFPPGGGGGGSRGRSSSSSLPPSETFASPLKFGRKTLEKFSITKEISTTINFVSP